MANFEIFEVPVAGGMLAISAMPRDLGGVAAWQPDLVVSMTQTQEFDQGIIDQLGAAGFEWRQVATKDFGIPAGLLVWAPVEAEILAVLARGGRVLIHCMGGCGRSGMAVLRCMIATGEDADTALLRLRSIRACAVETPEQLAWAQRS